MSSTAAAITIKARFKGEQRVISLGADEAKSIAVLESALKQSFGIEKHQNVSLTYLDEGDLITFDTDEELRLALKTEQQPLRVSVSLVKDRLQQGRTEPAENNGGAQERSAAEGVQQQEENEEAKKRRNLLHKAHLLHAALKKEASFGDLLPRACASLQTGFDMQLSPSELLTLMQVTQIPVRRLVMCGLVPASAVLSAVKEAEALESTLDTSTTSETTDKTGVMSDKDGAVLSLSTAAMEEDGEAEGFYHVDPMSGNDGAKTDNNSGEDETAGEGEEEEGEASTGNGGGDGGAVAAFLRSKGVPIKTRADVLAVIRAFRLPPRVFLRYEGVTVKDIHGYRHFFLNNCSVMAMLRQDGAWGRGRGGGCHGHGGRGGGKFGMMMMMHHFGPHHSHHHGHHHGPMKRDGGGLCSKRGGGGGRGGGMGDVFGMGGPFFDCRRGRGGHCGGGRGRGRGGRCGGGAGLWDQEMSDKMMAMQLQEDEFDQEEGPAAPDDADDAMKGTGGGGGGSADSGDDDGEPPFPPHHHPHEFGYGFGFGPGPHGFGGMGMRHPPHHPPPPFEGEGGAGGPPSEAFFGAPSSRGCPPDFQGRPHPFQGPPHAGGPHPHPRGPDFWGMRGGFGFGGPGRQFGGERWEMEQQGEGGDHGEEGRGAGHAHGRRAHAHAHEGRHRHAEDGRHGRRNHQHAYF